MHALLVYLASSVTKVPVAVAVIGVTNNGWAALNLSTGLAAKSLSLRSSASGAAEAAFAAAMADLSWSGSMPLEAKPCGCGSGVWMPIGPGAGFTPRLGCEADVVFGADMVRR